jgi:hypothetical protein
VRARRPWSAGAVARALERQEENRRRALVLLLEWPEGMPQLRTMGAGIGTLVALEKLGLAHRVGVDRLGELRFALTPEGRRAAEEQT